MYLKNITFSNSITIERNTLAPGMIGHIVMNESVDPETFVFAQRHFHYDQVGTVQSTSGRAGWGQNTKEYDPALGIFTSTAPYQSMMEHPWVRSL